MRNCCEHCHFRADLYLCLSIAYIGFWQKLLNFFLKKVIDCSCHVELHQIMLWNLNKPNFTTYLLFFITLNIVPACSDGKTGTRMETYVYEWEFIKWECSRSWWGERFAVHCVSSLCQPSAPPPACPEGRLQVSPSPARAGTGRCSRKRWGCTAPPAFRPEFGCCCCCFAGGRGAPVHCNLGILAASSSCQALAALSWISFFISKWLTSVFQGYCFPPLRLNTVSTTSAVAL